MHRMSQITYSIQFDMVRKINVTNEPVEYTSGFKKKKKKAKLLNEKQALLLWQKN